MARKKPQPVDPANVVSADSIKQSAIQQGSPNASQTMTVTLTAKNKNDLKDIVEKLLASLDKLGLSPKQADDVKADAEALKALLKKDEPKASVLRECLTSIKDVLQASATAMAASGAGQLVSNLLKEINKALGIV